MPPPTQRFSVENPHPHTNHLKSYQEPQWKTFTGGLDPIVNGDRVTTSTVQRTELLDNTELAPTMEATPTPPGPIPARKPKPVRLGKLPLALRRFQTYNNAGRLEQQQNPTRTPES
ncbi:hypothetical protein Ahia01_001279600 [Argonauta hians]